MSQMYFKLDFLTVHLNTNFKWIVTKYIVHLTSLNNNLIRI